MYTHMHACVCLLRLCIHIYVLTHMCAYMCMYDDKDSYVDVAVGCSGLQWVAVYCMLQCMYYFALYV